MCFRWKYGKQKLDTLNTNTAHTKPTVRGHTSTYTGQLLEKHLTNHITMTTGFGSLGFSMDSPSSPDNSEFTSGVQDITTDQFSCRGTSNQHHNQQQTDTLNWHFSWTDISLFSVFFLYTPSISLSFYLSLPFSPYLSLGRTLIMFVCSCVHKSCDLASSLPFSQTHM